MKGYIVIVLPTNVLEVYEFEGTFGELLLTALEFILERDLLFVLFIDYKSNVLLNVQRIVESDYSSDVYHLYSLIASSLDKTDANYIGFEAIATRHNIVLLQKIRVPSSYVKKIEKEISRRCKSYKDYVLSILCKSIYEEPKIRIEYLLDSDIVSIYVREKILYVRIPAEEIAKIRSLKEFLVSICEVLKLVERK